MPLCNEAYYNECIIQTLNNAASRGFDEDLNGKDSRMLDVGLGQPLITRHCQ